MCHHNHLKSATVCGKHHFSASFKESVTPLSSKHAKNTLDLLTHSCCTSAPAHGSHPAPPSRSPSAHPAPHAASACAARYF